MKNKIYKITGYSILSSKGRFVWGGVVGENRSALSPSLPLSLVKIQLRGWGAKYMGKKKKRFASTLSSR